MVASVGDDVNYRIGVALPTGIPGQVSGRNYSEGKVMLCIVYLSTVFGEYDRYIGNINHLW